MNDKTFKLRVPTKDLELWKLAASKTNMSLAVWIRNLCDSEVQMCGLERCNELRPRPDEATKVPEVRQEVSGAPKGEVCPHKKAKGSLCYKCDPKFGNPVIE